MNAMIFAAGLGTRLRPLTDNCPKALVKVAGKSLLEHNIIKLKAAGFDHIVVNVHHFGQQIIDFLADNDNFGIDIKVSDERDLLLDTGGGIRKALQLFDNDDPVLIHNVDIISDVDVKAVYDKHIESSAEATLCIAWRKTSRYLLFNENLRMCGWTNISTGEVKGEKAENMYAFAGIHVLNKTLIDSLDKMAKEENTDVFPIMQYYLRNCSEMRFMGYKLPENTNWVDCGKPESLTRACEIQAKLCCTT